MKRITLVSFVLVSSLNIVNAGDPVGDKAQRCSLKRVMGTALVGAALVMDPVEAAITLKAKGNFLEFEPTAWGSHDKILLTKQYVDTDNGTTWFINDTNIKDSYIYFAGNSLGQTNITYFEENKILEPEYDSTYNGTRFRVFMSEEEQAGQGEDTSWYNSTSNWLSNIAYYSVIGIPIAYVKDGIDWFFKKPQNQEQRNCTRLLTGCYRGVQSCCRRLAILRREGVDVEVEGMEE